MAHHTENWHSARLSRALRSKGAHVIPYVAGTHGVIGFPDKLVIHPRWQGLVEVKGPQTKTQEKQRHKMRQLDAVWPRHVVQARCSDEADSVVVTRYSFDAALESDVGCVSVDELIEFLASWSQTSD
jgi:hypothetical protein